VYQGTYPAQTILFPAISAHPHAFLVQACWYSELLDPNFPSLTDGVYPLVITSPRGFSSLFLDMCCGLAWNLQRDHDRLLVTTISPALAHFQTFLAHRVAGIIKSTYLGAAIPGQFCPNFGYYFQTAHNLWPTVLQLTHSSHSQLSHKFPWMLKTMLLSLLMFTAITPLPSKLC
jgi:hypothetical protein